MVERLGKLIIQYRQEHSLSQREFARQCDLSNTHIKNIEEGVDPRTGKPINITMPLLESTAKGMGVSLAELIERLGIKVVDIDGISDEQRTTIINMIKFFREKGGD